jgi:acyl-CoA synthetase (AMP-forming)/AMP-acid ligase II
MSDCLLSLSEQSPLAPNVNVAARLSHFARAQPSQIAVVVPQQRDSRGVRQYRTVSFAELDADVNRIASGLVACGAVPGMRLVLMVRPGIEFIALVFALLRTGAVTVLIDPGMGKMRMLRCLHEIEPEGFIAIPIVHIVRSLAYRRFKKARLNVTVGKKLFWGGSTLDEVRAQGTDAPSFVETKANDAAAIIFTTGSTGPPKGVLYSHGNFDQQVELIREQYGIAPGERDLAGFPLFGLFNAAMGVTTIVPDMDPTRPASVDPRNVVEAVRDWNATQSFASPAVWNVVGQHCNERGIQMPSLKRVLSAGAPVPPRVLELASHAISPDGTIHTPYGATEALPIATISAGEVLGETAAKTRRGEGTCVGRRFMKIKWRIIEISDDSIPTIDQCKQLAAGEIGELIVHGPVVTSHYVANALANELHKISDGDTFWHRMGDVGYLDHQDRFWFCGRKSHRVVTKCNTLFTEPCEAIFNQHAWVNRSALVGIGPKGSQVPVIVVELKQRNAKSKQSKMPRLNQIQIELAEIAQSNELTKSIRHFLFHAAFPVDIRHNAKIFREKLAFWAARRIKPLPEQSTKLRLK